jgi:2-methylcitrate dehydratase PrpD
MKEAAMLMHKIAAYVAAQRAAPIPQDVRHHVRRAVLDWYGALVAGAQQPPATLMRASFADELGGGRAVLHPDGLAAPARLAALINGTASHIAEFDDIFRDAIYHPGAPVIASALAAVQATGGDGEVFVRAVLAGYEVSTRIGVAVAPAHYRFWHPTGTVGTIGAAAACSVALGLDADHSAHAMATSATFAAALQQAFRSDAMSKPLHAGRAAEGGLTAALMAREGVTGALDILEGDAGFGAAMADRPDWEGAFSNLGEHHNVTAITFKNHGGCGHTFPAIDAALALCRQHGLTAADIDRIRIEGYRVALDVTGRKTATTPFEAKFCLRYGVANAVLYGRVRTQAFQPDWVNKPEIASLMERIDLVEDSELTKRFPRQRSARAVITTRTGERLEHLQLHRHGDPEEPLTDAELDDKFMELAAPMIGEQAATQTRSQVARLDSLSAAQLREIGVA